MQPTDMKEILDRAIASPRGVIVDAESQDNAVALRRRFYKLISTEKRKLSAMAGKETHPWPGIRMELDRQFILIKPGASDPTKVVEL